MSLSKAEQWRVTMDAAKDTLSDLVQEKPRFHPAGHIVLAQVNENGSCDFSNFGTLTPGIALQLGRWLVETFSEPTS